MSVNVLNKSGINEEFLLKLSEDDKILLILRQEKIFKTKRRNNKAKRLSNKKARRRDK